MATVYLLEGEKRDAQNQAVHGGRENESPGKTIFDGYL
jgi:hypothetical protein